MSQFNDAVSTLLRAFSDGISIIKTQRGRRKKEKLPIDSSRRAAETHLSKSLKKNRTEVKNAYERDVARFGPGFQVGDAEAHSSLSSILFRLNAGFVLVIERFTKGRSTPTDYQALQNLSNASRMEAIHTFEQLANRLSRPSLALPANKQHERHRHKRKSSKRSSSAVGHVRHARSKSAPELAVTPLGYANSEGWVRPKPGRKLSSDSSKSTGTSTPKRSPARKLPQNPPRQANPPPIPRSEPSPTLPLIKAPPPPPPPRARTENRKSIMSFASDSTKLGEIPEHRWNRPAMFDAANGNFPVTAFYPLEPYQVPEKPRSRLMRLFRR